MTGSLTKEPCVAEALERGRAQLAAGRIEGPARDAAILLAASLGWERAALRAHPEQTLTTRQRDCFEGFLARRLAREPVSRILGRREFWSLDLAVTPEVLDPRPDTETLVEGVIRRFRGREGPLHILDLGSGSGCILLALLSELPSARGLGVDRSEGAVRTAAANAEALGLADRARFQTGDWGRGLTGQWQAIVSNPPYIVEKEISDLAPEVSVYDPHLALSGGPDGLAAYRALLPDVARLLAPDGVLALEIGAGQSDAVCQLAESSGFSIDDLLQDLSGVQRCLVATPLSKG